MIKTDKNINNSHFTSINKNGNTAFASSLTYKLSGSSQAIDNGDPLFPTLNGDDIEGNIRTSPYDIGCFEYIP